MPRVLFWLTVFSMCSPATYYIDADRGLDANSGSRRSVAWRTISPLARTVLKAGDRVLFAGGQTHRAGICLEGITGPIVISSFGEGKATLDGGAGNGIVLENCANVTIKDLALVGAGRHNGNDGRGIQLIRTKGIRLDRVDVAGFRIAGVETGGDEDTQITRVVAHDNGFAGISVYSEHDGLPRSKRIVIRDCVARDNPGDPKNTTGHSGNGIVVAGVDDCLIERCVATNNGWDMPRTGNGPVGIWAWNSDRVTIQRCISYRNRSPGADGGGFDFDGGVTNSVMQHNLSYENDGCGYLLCQYPGAKPWRNNVVRFNISYEDGSRNFQSGIGLWAGDGGIVGATILNNTIVNREHAVASMGALPGFIYHNNLFVCGGDALVGDFSRSQFASNLYWTDGNAVVNDGKVVDDDRPTTYRTIDDWARTTGQESDSGRVLGIVADPSLVLPTTGDHLPTDPAELAPMRWFRPKPKSPALSGGFTPSRSGKDFGGRPLRRFSEGFLGAFGP